MTMTVTSYSQHKCDPDGAPLNGALDGPPSVGPGSAVRLVGTDVHGRVRLWWRCCSTALVEFMDDPEDPDATGAHTARYPLGELEAIPWDVPYSVPCVGAGWSLHLPCGHIQGEGCDCDTIAAEAAVQGAAITLVRVKALGGGVTQTFTIRGVVTDGTWDGDALTGVRILGRRVESGDPVDSWYAVGPDALNGSLIRSQTVTLDACGHDVTYGCDCDTIAAEAAVQG